MSDEQALINNVVQLQTGSIKGHASLTFGAAVMTEGRAPSATRRNTDRLAVEIQRYSLLSLSIRATHIYMKRTQGGQSMFSL